MQCEALAIWTPRTVRAVSWKSMIKWNKGSEMEYLPRQEKKLGTSHSRNWSPQRASGRPYTRLGAGSLRSANDPNRLTEPVLCSPIDHVLLDLHLGRVAAPGPLRVLPQPGRDGTIGHVAGVTRAGVPLPPPPPSPPL